ncbi:two-component system response regulator AlgR [Comamonas odontotermitis]|uniref:Two-component system response regulator AlgR n=1 Tax=Comamonas odontotermitis TaxID=379895 RepID=A0ABR6RFM6_9BURK|nr:LytTR family DNA-binding domain-containing protein [Comamonas odontotermitis]MBB6577824.1 two-component system response regulator AlgR [Comamonas odontotermitis]
MRILIVDDEALARNRMRRLLVERFPAPSAIHEATNAAEALRAIDSAASMGLPFDVALLDIHMPGQSGMELAQALQSQPHAPAVVFVTAHAEHALSAFEVSAADYLTKPVRRERLNAALQKVELLAQAKSAQIIKNTKETSEPEAEADETLLITNRGNTERVRLAEVVYFKSEFKYVTVRTSAHEYLWSGSLNELEERYADRYLRVHRNALVVPGAIRSLEKTSDPHDVDGWQLRLFGINDVLRVSRRQLPQVRALLAKGR